MGSVESQMLQVVAGFVILVNRLLYDPVDRFPPAFHDDAFVQYLREGALPNIVEIQPKTVRLVRDAFAGNKLLQSLHQRSCASRLAGLKLNDDEIFNLR